MGCAVEMKTRRREPAGFEGLDWADVQSVLIFHHSPITGSTLQMLVPLQRLRAMSRDAGIGPATFIPLGASGF